MFDVQLTNSSYLLKNNGVNTRINGVNLLQNVKEILQVEYRSIKLIDSQNNLSAMCSKAILPFFKHILLLMLMA